MFEMLNQVLSLKGSLGVDSLTDFFTQGSGLLPILGVGAVWLLGGSMLRSAFSLLPIAVLVLFMLGSDSGASQSIAGMTQNFSNVGWLPIALVVFVLMNMSRGRLFAPSTLIAIAAAIYLMGARDFSVGSLLNQGHGSGNLAIIGCAVGGIILLMIFRRFFRGRNYRYGYARPSFLQMHPETLKLIVTYAAAGLGLVLVSLLITDPAKIEHALPGWRSGVGAALLLGSLLAFGLTLPQRARVWALPFFWCAVCITISVELYAPHHTVSTARNFSVMEKF